MAFGERCAGLKVVREGFDLVEEEGVREVVVGGGVNEGGSVVCCGGGGEERECIVDERERFRGWRERDVWTEAVEGSVIRTETGFWVDICVRH